MMHFNWLNERQKRALNLVVSILGGLTLAILSSAMSQIVHADEGLSYFSDSEINYWKEPKVQGGANGKQVDSEKPKPDPSLSALPHGPGSPFPWKKYLDSKNDEFFKEGDYLPPAPFMELARDPSDVNVANWFKYLELKNQISERLQARLTEYASKQRGQLPAARTFDPALLEKASARLPAQSSTIPMAKRFKLRMYFDSHCPHCEHMIGTLQQLRERGFWVELKQVNEDPSSRARIPFPVEQATPAELKKFQVDAVPVVLVGDLQSKTFFRIQGYQTEQAVLEALQAQAKATIPKAEQGRPL